jgi:GntR family transcriptional regulator, transcriptional repressor for pyruvate dehydrogenase complex
MSLAPVPSKFNSDTHLSATIQGVVESIYGKIQSGVYSVDERLPSERTLAAELNVARNTVREALEVLEGHDIIRRRAGSGSFVNPPNNLQKNLTNSEVSDTSSPLDLQVMRGIVEPDMVRLAVVNMSPRDLESLGETLSKIETIRTDANAFVSAEEEFYRKLAAGTANPLIIACYEIVLDACRQSFRSAHLRRHLTPLRIEKYQKRYNSLFNAIAARDTDAAVEFIRLHLIEEQRQLLQD